MKRYKRSNLMRMDGWKKNTGWCYPRPKSLYGCHIFFNGGLQGLFIGLADHGTPLNILVFTQQIHYQFNQNLFLFWIRLGHQQCQGCKPGIIDHTERATERSGYTGP
jgi:hypothetical protein